MSRRKKGTPPSYRLHKATGQAVVTVHGRDVYLGPYESADSRSRYAQLIAESVSNPVGPVDVQAARGGDFTVVELCERFLTQHAIGWYMKNGRPTNEIDAIKNIIRDLRALYGHLPVDQFGPLSLKTIRQQWIDRGHARTTVNKNAGRLKRIFKWGVAEELVQPGTFQALQAVEGLRRGRSKAKEMPPVLPVDLHAVERTLPYLPLVIRDMIRFQLLTGARPGEVCMLTPASVNRSGDVWEYHVEGHKTEHHGRNRTIYVGPEAQAILTPYLLRDQDRVCFAMEEALQQRREARFAARTTPLSCGNRPGKRSSSDRQHSRKSRKPKIEFTTSSYRKSIQNACDVAFPAPEPLACMKDESDEGRKLRLTTEELEELKLWQREHRWFPNQLRHTRATEIRREYGLEAAQVILGHAACSVTQVYAERDAEKAREVARKIG